MQVSRWKPVTKKQFIAFSIGVGLFILIILRSKPGFVFILDGANLLFHEAGHFFFGLLGSTMGLYGGTLGQLTFPVILIICFWKQGESVSFAVGWIWYFENFLNIAHYVADARSQMLPLVGGGEHDWYNILMRWDALQYDSTIAAIVRSLGWVGIVTAWAWVAWRGWREKQAA